MVTNESAPMGPHRRCGLMKLIHPAGAEDAFEVISLRNFRSANISAQTLVVAGSIKPPNINLEIGCPVRVASMVAVTGCAEDVPAITRINWDKKKSTLLYCMSDLQLTNAWRCETADNLSWSIMKVLTRFPSGVETTYRVLR
jgi:hypothetical protein